MQVSLDEMYDVMLHAEFGAGGKHAAAGPVVHQDTNPHGKHVAVTATPIHEEFETALQIPEVFEAATQIPEEAATPIHEELEAATPQAVVEQAPAENEGPRGLARYRNAAMVGAGGLACAAVGAFLGGLGGYFTVNPAAARSLASTTAPDQSLAAAVNQAVGAASSGGSAALGSATLTSLSGSLTQGIAPLQWLTSGSGTLPTTATLADLPGGGTSGIGSGSGSGAGTGTGSDLGLGGLINSVTTTLGSLGTGSSDPTSLLDGPAPTLTGVITDLTGTLADLSSLVPITSVPLPSGGLPTSGLPGLGTPSTGLPGNSGGGTSPLSSASALAAALNGLTPAAGGTSVASGSRGATGSSSSLPTPSSVGGSLPSLPGLPATSSSGTTTTTTTSTTTPSGSSGGGTTTVTVPVPVPPVSVPPVSVGGVSAGVSTGGSGSGLTLNLP